MNYREPKGRTEEKRTERELWNRFILSGRIEDYLAYSRFSANGGMREQENGD